MKVMFWEDLVDRAKWAPGPWDGEPDKVQWSDMTSGLPCLIVRNELGALCGYVGLPPSHPFYEVGYSNIPSSAASVHGGLTFSDHCDPGCKICHITEPGDPDPVWWLGFDCAHAGDDVPGMAAYGFNMGRMFPGESYKNMKYVREQCENLARQLWGVEHPD